MHLGRRLQLGATRCAWVAAIVLAVAGTGRAEAAASVGVGPLSFDAIAGTAYSGTVGSFSSSRPTTNPADFAATLTWGDGAVSAGIVAFNGPEFSVAGSHTYAAAGTYNVTVTVVDRVGNATGATVSTAQVGASTGLTVFPNTITVASGQASHITIATAVDARAAAAANDLSATIDWGDGTAPTAAAGIAKTSGAFSILGDHTYALAENFQVQVTVLDGVSTASASATSTAQVAPDSTVGAFPVTIHAVAGISTSAVVATFADGRAAATAGDFDTGIFWGDGTPPESGTVVGATGAGFELLGTHTYVSPGTFSVQVIVLDDDIALGAGATSTALVAPAGATIAQVPALGTVGLVTLTLLLAGAGLLLLRRG